MIKLYILGTLSLMAIVSLGLLAIASRPEKKLITFERKS